MGYKLFCFFLVFLSGLWIFNSNYDGNCWKYYHGTLRGFKHNVFINTLIHEHWHFKMLYSNKPYLYEFLFTYFS